MSEQYMRSLLRVSIAQICQTIGYNAIQITPLELLQDNLNKFLHEFCRDLRRQVEHYNRSDANLNDVCLTLGSLNINVNELLEYIFNVQPVTFSVDVPKFPMPKESSLNFLKPGSKEVLIRPVHIYEHLPPILPPDNCVNVTDGNDKVAFQSTGKTIVLDAGAEDVNVAKVVEVASDSVPTETKSNKLPLETLEFENKPVSSDENMTERSSLPTFFKVKNSARASEEEGRPTREIGSVMMTTGGFISPAIEGKLPDAHIPNLIDILEGLDVPPQPALSCPCSRPESRTSMGTPTHLAGLKDMPKDETEEKASTVSLSQTQCPIVVTDDNGSYKMQSQVAHTGGIASASPRAISAAAALRLAKKHVPANHSALVPPLAARILKKAKKKSSLLNFPSNGNAVRAIFEPSNDVTNASMSLNEKSQRKRMKILQKLVKSAKSSEREMGSDCLQMEKIFKKQSKHKQKILRHDMTVGRHSKTLENLKQTKQAHHTNSTNMLTDKCVSSIDQVPRFMSCSEQVHLSEKTNTKIKNAPALNLSQGKFAKHSPTAPQNLLNSMQGYRGVMHSKIPIPVFGEKDVTENKTMEVKLSTEPDRTKLNIFKKITSKQKHSNRSISPTVNAPAASQIYSGNESQVISLPSGTTITPALPTSGRHVYAPDNDSMKTVQDSVTSSNVASHGANNSSCLFSKVSLVEDQDVSMNLIQKPKKRGRKPGSKNQPKAQKFNMITSSKELKKPKKIKVKKDIYGPQVRLSAEQSIEPLNLSHSFSTESDINLHIPLGIASTFPLFDQNVLQRENKERKERRKTKTKDATVVISDNLEAPVICMVQQQQRGTNKKSSDSSFAAPTKEEVDSINRKLLRMDTVLQPAPPLQSTMITTHGNTSKEPSLSPAKSRPMSSSPVSKQRSSQQRNTSVSLSLSSATLEGPMISPVQNFPNMLSMLPLYPFPPRPGLIPTPGLFPSVLGGFPNIPSNPASNLLLQGFIPFPGLKPQMGGNLRSTGMKINDRNENTAEMEVPVRDRSYCNVAPLVPDSLKLKLPSPGAGGTSLISPKLVSFAENVTPKTPQLRQSPTTSDTVRESLQQKLTSFETPESSSVGSKSIPATPGGISLNTFDNLLRSSGEISSISSTTSNSISLLDPFRHRTLSINSDRSKSNPDRSILNEEGPIEVSDDSGDAIVSGNAIPTQVLKSKTVLSYRSYVKPHVLPGLLKEQMNDIFTPIDNNFQKGINQSHLLLSGNNKEARRLKKLNKFGKKRNSTSPVASCGSLDTFVGGAGSEGVGKLAGGADLIPLTTTGLAYSSKKTPTNSLTASATSSSIETNNRGYDSTDVLNNTTESTTLISDLQNKRKDHKKIKKLKYGKIKKKKDKKDKTKNKEKYMDSTIEKRVKEKDPDKLRDKEALKKLKKEKKKEKQRSVRNLSSPTSTTSKNIIGYDIASNSNITSITTSLPLVTSNSSVIPKLTLKIGGCQSPTFCDDLKRKSAYKSIGSTTIGNPTRDPSPELARISPLVTRPPKQKINLKDNLSSGNLSAGGAASENRAGGVDADFLTTNISFKTNDATSIIVSKNKDGRNTCGLNEGSMITANNSPTTSTSKLLKHKNSGPQHSSSVLTATTDSFETQLQNSTSASDAEGNRVWICPACGKVDDGSAMIGCDSCDAWYHWVCVGIFVAPKDNEDWFCRVCIAKKKGVHGIDRKRKRNKKK